MQSCCVHTYQGQTYSLEFSCCLRANNYYKGIFINLLLQICLHSRKSRLIHHPIHGVGRAGRAEDSGHGRQGRAVVVGCRRTARHWCELRHLFLICDDSESIERPQMTVQFSVFGFCFLQKGSSVEAGPRFRLCTSAGQVPPQSWGGQDPVCECTHRARSRRRGSGA